MTDVTPNISSKEVYVFDLDGTLAESKQAIDPDMSMLLERLLEKHKIAIISGGSYAQINKELIAHMPPDSDWDNLFLFPVSGTAFYRRAPGGWQEVYSEKLAERDKDKISLVLLDAEEKLGIKEDKVYGNKIEDRGSQVTYSGLGQDAPIEVKRLWDPDQSKRRRMVAFVTPFLSGFNIGIGGTTSIDVTKGGIDKGFGMRQISETLNVPIPRMIFIGDALSPGGNDYPAKATGVDCIEVLGPIDTKAFINKVI